jgi:hypothetical protein
MADKTPLQAILALVAYLEKDEREHYEANGHTADHVYNHVKAVSDWLEARGMGTPAEREQQRLQPIADAFAAHGVPVVGDFAACGSARGSMYQHRGSDRAAATSALKSKGAGLQPRGGMVKILQPRFPNRRHARAKATRPRV